MGDGTSPQVSNIPRAHLTLVWSTKDPSWVTSQWRAALQMQAQPSTPCPFLGRTSSVCPLFPQWTDGPPPVQFQAQNGPNTSLASLL